MVRAVSQCCVMRSGVGGTGDTGRRGGVEGWLATMGLVARSYGMARCGGLGGEGDIGVIELKD